MAHRQIVVTGASALCYINGTLIGRVSSFTMLSTTDFRSARGIDIPTVQEKIPTIFEVNFTIGLIRTMGDSGAQGTGMVVQPQDLSRVKYFTVLIIDRRTDLPLFKADYCVAKTEQWGLDARGRMIGTISCEGIVWSNEFSPSASSISS